MRSQTRNHRRHRTNKEPSDELPLRHDESYAEPYSRSHSHSHSHHVDSYRAPSSSSRTSYDMNREASSSRTHHESDSWHPPSSHDKYEPTDNYRRGPRDDYDVMDSRGSDTWARPTNDSHSLQSREDWSQRYDKGYSSSSYPETSSWSSRNPSSYDDRNVSYSHWSQDEPRSHPVDDRGRDVLEKQSDRDSAQWQREERRDDRRDKNEQKWQADSGWDSRRRDGQGSARDVDRDRWAPTPAAPVLPPPESPSIKEHRSWEPAPGWRSPDRHDIQRQRSQNGQRRSSPTRSLKGGKRTQTQNKQKRDWRTDDGNLNK